MKRVVCFFLGLCIILLISSCSKPDDIVNPCDVKETLEPVTFLNDTFYIELFNGEEFIPASYIIFNNAYLDVYYDEEYKNQVKYNIINPIETEEQYYILATSPQGDIKEYKLNVHNHILERLEIIEEYNKYYNIGDAFDKTTISVYGISQNEKILIDNYELSYDFSKKGLSVVNISFKGLNASVECVVSGSDYPTLDSNFKLGNGLEFVFNKNEDGFLIKSGKEYRGYLYIPDVICYNDKLYNIVGIDEYCFQGNENITGVKSNKYITFVGEGAFQDCVKLKEAIFESNTTFSPFSFDGCSTLEKVVLPDILEDIPYNMFSHCYELYDFNLPDCVKTIGSQAFYECNSIKEIILPSFLEFLGNRAFKGCKNLIRASVNYKTSFMGEGAFANCENLEILVLPAMTTYEDDSVIFGCDKVTVYTGKNNSLLYYLKKNEIPHEILSNNSLYIINQNPIYYMNDVFNESDCTIISYYDDDISIINSFTTSYNFKYPGENTVTFYCDKGISQIKVFVEYDITLYDEISDRGEIFSFNYEDYTCSLSYVPKDLKYNTNEGLGTYIAPSHVILYGEKFTLTCIDSGAFDDIDDLTKIVLPSTITQIESYAIENCKDLKAIYIPCPVGQKLKVNDDSFLNLNEDTIIMCSLNNSIMHYYVRTHGIKYCGIDSNKIYVNAVKGAKTTYNANEIFNPNGFYCVFVDELYDVSYIDLSDLIISYDFSENNVVSFSYKGLLYEYKVTLN